MTRCGQRGGTARSHGTKHGRASAGRRADIAQPREAPGDERSSISQERLNAARVEHSTHQRRQRPAISRAAEPDGVTAAGTRRCTTAVQCAAVSAWCGEPAESYEQPRGDASRQPPPTPPAVFSRRSDSYLS
ncbi:hypothetical protein FJT64_016715 [Amphibalanus amphitrite]|uniref:Uncharacterized protein n=1 Tax=Amphibalanus amphitrite TaxID=1232801 RepID=A0A6A4WZN1_AMPAM|nr:hypothetical protein FJT64_016715 [Amphibalanus amphitrite]